MQNSDVYESDDGFSQSFGKQARSMGEDMREVASQAKEKMTDTLREQASKISDKARNMATGAGSRIENLMEEQRASGASYLHQVAGLVHQAADVFEREVPQASQYIHQAAEHIHTVADAVRTKKAREVVHDVQNFARQQPAIFFGSALLLGFAAVRIVKASPPMSSGQSEPAGAKE